MADMLQRYAACAIIYAATMAAFLICRSLVACTIRNMYWKFAKHWVGGGASEAKCLSGCLLSLVRFTTLHSCKIQRK